MHKCKQTILLFAILIGSLSMTSLFGSVKELIEESTEYQSIAIDKRLLCDLELLLNGGFAPLNGFLSQEDYESVVEKCRLKDGSIWPIPIVLPIDKSFTSKIKPGDNLTITDNQGIPLAILKIQDIYKPDLEYECLKVFGTTDKNHPSVKRILSNANVYYVGGPLRKISLPKHYDFQEFRLTPQEVKDYIKKNQWNKVIGFQTRNPLHKSHLALTLSCIKNEKANLLLHPVVGVTQPGDVDYHTRVRCYKNLLHYYPKDQVKLSLLPLAMRMAGPREALWHALIRQNYGCTHFIIGRDHAGPSTLTAKGEKFYKPYQAQEFVKSFQKELNIKVLTSKEIVYVKELDKYLPIDSAPSNSTILKISGTDLRNKLINNLEIPSWFSFPDIISELRSAFKKNLGFCVYFTGLSGSGKSTLARALKAKIREMDPFKRDITILDGDVVRKNLSKGLGFTKEGRSLNTRRIGFVASLIVKNGGICICANIAPYESDRKANRSLISNYGPYIEVFVNTPMSVCEERDAKGLYRLARQGKIKLFTGISDPYVEPSSPEVSVNGSDPIEISLKAMTDCIRKITPLD